MAYISKDEAKVGDRLSTLEADYIELNEVKEHIKNKMQTLRCNKALIPDQIKNQDQNQKISDITVLS